MAGAFVTLVVTRMLQTFLFELSPRDPATLLTAALLLTGVSVLAGFVPARRASLLDPMTTLRRE